VAYLIAQILGAHHHHVGLTVSPHVYQLSERIQVDGQPIADQALLDAARELQSPLRRAFADGWAPSFYQMMTLLAFVALRQAGVTYGVIETGVGGRLDTTNTMTRADKVAVITTIGLDHTQLLGATLSAIARQKAGIITTLQPVFVQAQSPSARRAITAQAKLHQARIESVEPERRTLNLPGKHNQINAQTAVDTARWLAGRDGWRFDEHLAQTALTAGTIPGRFERFRWHGQNFIFDGAHNTQKLSALLTTVAARWSTPEVGIIFASSKQVDERIYQRLGRVAGLVVMTRYYDSTLLRYRPARDLRSVAQGYGHIWQDDHDAVVNIIAANPDKIWVVTGSFFILGELKKKLVV
jgi:dihydrofolate synthase/folylpolyglutamate synthase